MITMVVVTNVVVATVGGCDGISIVVVTEGLATVGTRGIGSGEGIGTSGEVWLVQPAPHMTAMRRNVRRIPE